MATPQKMNVTQNNLWFGTYTGMLKFNGKIWRNYTKSDGLTRDHIDMIAIDTIGNKWIANGNVTVYNDSTWSSYLTGDKLPAYSYTNTINIDTKNKKWFGTTYGVVSLNDTTWNTYNNICGFSQIYIMSSCIDSDGNKWFGDRDNGIFKLEDNGAGPFKLFTPIIGCVFIDLNANGIKDKNEIGWPNQIVQIDSNITNTNNNGLFYLNLSKGQHTFKYNLLEYWQLTTDSTRTVNITKNENLDTIYFGVTPIENINDVQTTITGTATRVNFKSQYWIDYKNIGTLTQNGTLVLNIDPKISFINSIPIADTVIENRLVWNVNTLIPQQQKQIQIFTQMPDFKALGDTLFSTVAIYINTSDTNLINNFDTIKQIITGSIDPNDKQVKEGKGALGYTLLNNPLTYSIRFQNTGTDTAFNVNIRDTLSPNLDISTLKILASSFPVRLELRGTNEATFHFDNILLPDSNVNQIGSNGFIKYSIKPKTNLSEKTIVMNKAYIFFDFNPAVITNETKNTYVSVMPDTITSIDNKAIETNNSFTIYPNPTKQNVTITFNSIDNVNTIEIVNTIGQTVYAKHIQTTSNSEQLDLSNLQSGIYFIKVKTDNGNFIKKIVKD